MAESRQYSHGHVSTSGARYPVGLGPPLCVRAFRQALTRTTRRHPVVLEVGIGDGRLRNRLVHTGLRWIGIDIDPERVTRARALGFEAHTADIRHGIDRSSGSVDGVVLVNVMNCIPSAADRHVVFREVGRLLRPGGVLWYHDFERVTRAGDPRIGGEVDRGEWKAYLRRYARGGPILSLLLGDCPDLMPTAFPAFTLTGHCPPRLRLRFHQHRYRPEEFVGAATIGYVRLSFVAFHATLREAMEDCTPLGTPTVVRPGVNTSRGGCRLPAFDLLVRTE